jgi:hypothetical protein
MRDAALKFPTALKQLHIFDLVPYRRRTKPMRGIMLGSALAALAILPPQASVAATERWCAVINLGSVGPAERCGNPVVRSLPRRRRAIRPEQLLPAG